jgi:hypothetical protein
VIGMGFGGLAVPGVFSASLHSLWESSEWKRESS